MKKYIAIIVLLFASWSTSLANIDDWGEKENLKFAAHYKNFNGKVKLIKKWKGSDLHDKNFRDTLFNGSTSVDSNELIIVLFHVDKSKLTKNDKPAVARSNIKNSTGWKYEVKDGVVMAWEGRTKVVKPLKLEKFYKRLDDLIK